MRSMYAHTHSKEHAYTLHVHSMRSMLRIRRSMGEDKEVFHLLDVECRRGDSSGFLGWQACARSAALCGNRRDHEWRHQAEDELLTAQCLCSAGLGA